LAGNIVVARDFFSSRQRQRKFPAKNERRIRLGAKLSGNFQQKMSAEYDWVRSSAARELAVETHQKH
jgi:hypothetical protein